MRVLVEGERLKIVSGRHGSRSAIAFSSATDDGALAPGLAGGEAEAGRDIEGRINGTPAEGRAQLLRAPEGSGPAAGLRLLVRLNEEQLDPEQPEASVVITKGIASRVASYLNTLVDPLEGRMRTITENLRSRVGNIDDQLERLDERIAAKRERLQGRFERLEQQISQMRGQQRFMQSQLAQAGAGGGVSGLLQALPGNG